LCEISSCREISLSQFFFNKKNLKKISRKPSKVIQYVDDGSSKPHIHKKDFFSFHFLIDKFDKFGKWTIAIYTTSQNWKGKQMH
jgi:hypothetical protein